MPHDIVTIVEIIAGVVVTLGLFWLSSRKRQ
jgi:hypothetical protein